MGIQGNNSKATHDFLSLYASAAPAAAAKDSSSVLQQLHDSKPPAASQVAGHHHQWALPFAGAGQAATAPRQRPPGRKRRGGFMDSGSRSNAGDGLAARREVSSSLQGGLYGLDKRKEKRKESQNLGGERMRKQKQKAYPRSSRGQTTLQSFLFKHRFADGELNRPPPLPQDEDEIPNSLPAPPKREIVRVTNKTIKEKTSAFSSVGSSAKNVCGEAGAASTLNASVFKRFNSSSPPAARAECSAEARGDADEGGCSGSAVRLDVEDITAGGRRPQPRKRKSPLGGGDERNTGNARHVVVLGDDPRPRPPPSMRRGRPSGRGQCDNGLYNHYASGGGLWQGEQEGVDGEEVGWTDDMWEGMGSITLGGMEWH